MYINNIIYNYLPAFTFLTNEECLTPHNPTYKKLQEVLEGLGFKPECNHVFNRGNEKLHFTHSEVDSYEPNSNDIEMIKYNRKQLGDGCIFVDIIEYILIKNIKPESVERILKRELKIE